MTSTFGAVEIAFSLSTLKFGLTVYPKIIAVRLFGKVRTDTL